MQKGDIANTMSPHDLVACHPHDGRIMMAA
jgi:hypothetical protein